MVISSDSYHEKTRKISLYKRTVAVLPNKNMDFDNPTTTITRKESVTEQNGKSSEMEVRYTTVNNGYTTNRNRKVSFPRKHSKASEQVPNRRRNAKLSLQMVPPFVINSCQGLLIKNGSPIVESPMTQIDYNYNANGLCIRRRSRRLSLPQIIASRANSRRSSRRDSQESRLPVKRTPQELLALMKKTIRLVRTLSCVCIAIRRYVINKTDSSAEMIDIQQYKVPREKFDHTKSQTLPISFNKQSFSVVSKYTFPFWARSLCLMPTHLRPMDGLMKLQKYLRGIPVFSKFNEKAQIEICRNITYNRYDKMRVILKQGDNPEYFYILIAGTVYVNISTKDVNTGVEVTATYDLIGRHEAFGANALIHGTKRTATIISHTFVEVLLIDQDIFMDYCCDSLQASIEKEKMFLRSHEVFRTWSSRSMKLILYDVKTKTFPPGKIVESDLVNSKYLYFIMEGVVEIMYSGGGKRKLLYSSLLGRTVGALGGIHIHAPNPCNLSSIAKTTDIAPQQVKCFMISHGATVLYLSKSRFTELAPKDYLDIEHSDTSHFLSDVEYKKVSKQAIAWIEYRAKTATENVRFPLRTRVTSA